MSLPAVQLDDLEWQQMISAVRSRIAARSNGKWTMHAAVDPGVTLLELFAYQFEQRLYWMDQVPEQTVRAVLAMLDAAPATMQAAQTVLSLSPQATQPTQVVAAGQRFESSQLERPQPMTSREDVNVLPVAVDPMSAGAHGFRVSVHAGGRDRSTDLRGLQTVELLPADGSAAAFHITLWLDRPFNADEIDGACHLLIDLDAPEQIQPEWAPEQTELTWSSRLPEDGYDTSVLADEIFDACGLRYHTPPGLAADGLPCTSDDSAFGPISQQWALQQFHVAPPALLRWTYRSAAGERAFTDDNFVDGTVGLRRSGLLRIRIPAEWQPEPAAGPGPVAYRITAHCESCDFATPPVLRQVVPNVFVAQNVECVRVPWSMLGPSIEKWLRLPGQTLPLRTDGLPPIENSVRLFLREADGEWRRWQPTDHFYRHGPMDRVFTVDCDRRRIIFGNGITGRIPVLFDSGATARMSYLCSGGEAGNVDEQGWLPKSIDNRTFNVVAAIGGKDAELASDARARAAADLKRIERAVTQPDYVALARSTPGVAVKRAHAAVGLHPGYPCQHTAGAVTLMIVPDVPRPALDERNVEDIVIRAPRSDPGEVGAVAARVEARRLLGHEVYVRPVNYRHVRLNVELDGVVLEEDGIKASIERELAAFLDPIIGGHECEGWPFGEPIRPSTLMRRIKFLLPDGVNVREVGIALDNCSRFETCNEVAIGEHNLVQLAELHIRINRRLTSRGGLL